jgi:hypothetical protein
MSTELDAAAFVRQTVLTPKGVGTLVLSILVLILLVNDTLVVFIDEIGHVLTECRQRLTKRICLESQVYQSSPLRSPSSVTSTYLVEGPDKMMLQSSQNGAKSSTRPSINAV